MSTSQSVYLSDDALRQLKRLSKRTGESLSQVVCRCIKRTTVNDLLNDQAAEIAAKQKEVKQDKFD